MTFTLDEHEPEKKNPNLRTNGPKAPVNPLVGTIWLFIEEDGTARFRYWNGTEWVLFNV